MPNKFICNMSTEELTRLYIDEKRTLPEMCEIIGVKNVITAGKILRSRGIITNTNTRKANKVKHGMSDEVFKKYLETEYTSGKTLKEIGDTLGVTIACVRKYFVKYGIKRRTKKNMSIGAKKTTTGTVDVVPHRADIFSYTCHSTLTATSVDMCMSIDMLWNRQSADT